MPEAESDWTPSSPSLRQPFHYPRLGTVPRTVTRPAGGHLPPIDEGRVRPDHTRAGHTAPAPWCGAVTIMSPWVTTPLPRAHGVGNGRAVHRSGRLRGRRHQSQVRREAVLDQIRDVFGIA